MKKEKEILILRQKLTELRLLEKMQRWTFYNSRDLPEKKWTPFLMKRTEQTEPSKPLKQD